MSIITRATSIAAQITVDISDFTDEEIANILVNADAERGFQCDRPADLLNAIRRERSIRRTRTELAALVVTPSTWGNKELPKVEFTEGMYGQSRMTNTSDEPDGYMGE